MQFCCGTVNSWCVCDCACVLQAALLAGRTNKALVSREDFSQAVLRSVAGIEKKRSILQGLEKEVVARHEVST
jgi:cell division protease FtsH